MSVVLNDIIKIMEEIAPAELAEQYDNVGLLIGNKNSLINTIMVSLDINDSVIDEAIHNKCNLILTHHPLIYTPLKSINTSNFKENMVFRLIASNINVFSAHTNLDVAENGISSFLASKLELENVSVLDEVKIDNLFKLAVYVPLKYEDRVRNAILDEGAGYIGNYSNCTFNIEGEGTFLPMLGSAPFIGNVGTTEHVNEVKIETIVPASKLNKVVKKMIKVHPYEDPAYDIFLLANKGKKYGYVRTGYLKQPISLNEFCCRVKEILNINMLNVSGCLNRTIKKVGLCSGSGSNFIKDVFEAGCDVYLTGDIKYHNVCDARDMGLAIIDAGHFATENIYMQNLLDELKLRFESLNYDIDIVLSNMNKDPYQKV